MEWSWSFWNHFYILVGLVFFFQVIEGHSRKHELELVTMPGDACSYIKEEREQYQVISAGNGDNDSKYQSNVTCSITFRGKEDEKFIIRITKFALQFSNLCSQDALYIYDGINDNAEMLTKHGYGLCGETMSLPNYFTSSGGAVTIKFVTDRKTESEGFSLYVTPFTKTANCTGFLCTESQKCISKHARCNRAFQCEDGSDEPPNCSLAESLVSSTPRVLLLVVLAAVFTRLR